MTVWRAICVEIGEAHADALSDALLEAGALSVSVEDAGAGREEERALFGEPGSAPAAAWPRNRVVALCDPAIDPAGLVAHACAVAGLTPAAFEVETVEETDWVRATQSQFAPVRAGERLWIVPSWHEPPRDPDAVVVRLDPGLAFGTGSHATTRLVLRWLERAGCQGARVLDYGCGSGILGLTAARLGAVRVDAVDVDPQALVATSANAEANGIALRCLAPGALPAGAYDLVLANILANPLIVLAPLLAARCRPGGRLALSGVLAAEADEVAQAYRPAFAIEVAQEEEGWVLLQGQRA